MKRRATLTSIWLFALPVLVLQLWSANAWSLAPVFAKLESLNFDEICGLDADGKTACLKNDGMESSWIPDTVGTLSHIFSNELASCGFDERGLKCWKLSSGYGKIDGLNQTDAIRRFFESTEPASVHLGPTSFCGLDRVTGDLRCLMPKWAATPSRTLRVTPKHPISVVRALDEAVCWIENPGPAAKIKCRGERGSSGWANDRALPGAYDLQAGGDWACARSKTEGRCWTDRDEASLPQDFVSARNWASNEDGLCALTQDRRVICADPITGQVFPTGFGHAVPAEFASPNPLSEELWIANSTACVRDLNQKLSCWSWWNATASVLPFTRPVRSVTGSGYSPCAILDNGQAECRMHALESQTLSNGDRIRVEFGGYNKCYWNASGLDCRGRVDNLAYRSVKDVASSRYDEALCIVGTPIDEPGGLETVRCFSYDNALRAPPGELRNPYSVSVSDNKACALSDEGLTCWGGTYLETPPPNTVSQPSKLEMSSRHACLMDQFGFVCWGELTTLGLAIPRGLEQPGRVVDFALGSSRTCAILDDGSIECWGTDFENSGEPPFTRTATSILGRAGLFCALDKTGVHCWGGDGSFPK